MFERFTERGRQVVVHAQEAARTLRHDSIGTEHILLGLLDEGEGVAAEALASLGVTRERVRAEVERIVGSGDAIATGQMPFAPRAKKVLEVALREGLTLGHNYVDTEHILLGLAREREGIAARILDDFGAGEEEIRDAVLGRLHPGVRRRAASSRDERTPKRTAPGRPPAVFLALGWTLFAVAFVLGVGLGWLIWG